MERDQSILVLPTSIATKIDIGRLVREAGALQQFLDQAAIRQTGTPMSIPKMSRLMDEIIQSNNLNVLEKADRDRLLGFVMEVRKHAPVLHMSFSADPSPHFVKRLMTYLREEIHPLVLLQVGLQPNIGAGCVVRTTNKYFDFSLRQHFSEKREVLMHNLRGASYDTPTTQEVAQ